MAVTGTNVGKCSSAAITPQLIWIQLCQCGERPFGLQHSLRSKSPFAKFVLRIRDAPSFSPNVSSSLCSVFKVMKHKEDFYESKHSLHVYDSQHNLKWLSQLVAFLHYKAQPGCFNIYLYDPLPVCRSIQAAGVDLMSSPSVSAGLRLYRERYYKSSTIAVSNKMTSHKD